MKKLLILLMLHSCITASAYDFEVGGLCYSINNDSKTVSIVSPTSTAFCGELVIPSAVAYGGKNYMVTSLSSRAFKDCTGITGKLTIPSTITDIGWEVFKGCSGISSLSMESSYSLVSAANMASSYFSGVFGDCTGLKSVFWNSPMYAKSFEYLSNNNWEYVFDGCTGIETIEFGCNVDSIQEGFCSGAINLKMLIIPKSVKFVGSDNTSTTEGVVVDQNNPVFDSRENCNAIIETSSNTLIAGCKTTIIPNSVTKIGSQAFMYCRGLTEVTIPNSVTSIGNSAFYGCSGLTSVTIPNSVTSIGSSAFNGCSGLASVTIPNRITSIGSRAFRDCTSLTSVTIGNSVTSIGESAFSGCSGLTSVTIGNSVTSIGDKAFEDCSGLTSVTWNAKSCADFTSTTTPFSSPSIKTFTFGNEVKKIPAYLCYQLTGLTSVAISNSVTYIAGTAFDGTAWYNNQLDGLVYAGLNAYKYKGTMPSGTSIEIQEGTKSISSFCFMNCSGLTSVTIPNSVTSIGESAFSGCSDLADIFSEIANPTTRAVASDAFSSAIYPTCTLHVPAETKHMYQVTSPWNNFENIVEGEGKHLCDVNGDGVVDIFDVNMVINAMLGK